MGILIQFYIMYVKEHAPLLAPMYWRSLEEQKFPENWKKVQVILIFKKKTTGISGSGQLQNFGTYFMFQYYAISGDKKKSPL